MATKTTKKEEIKTAKTLDKKDSVKPVADKTAGKSDEITAKKTTAAPVEKTTAAKKSAAKKYHIAQRSDDNMWQVKAEGAEKALKLFKTQQEAIDYAKKVAGNQEGSIMIHKKDGSFRKLTY